MSKKLFAIPGVTKLVEKERAAATALAAKVHKAAHKAFVLQMVEMMDTHTGDAKDAGNPDAAKRIRAVRDWFKRVAKEVTAS